MPRCRRALALLVADSDDLDTVDGLTVDGVQRTLEVPVLLTLGVERNHYRDEKINPAYHVGFNSEAQAYRSPGFGL